MTDDSKAQRRYLGDVGSIDRVCTASVASSKGARPDRLSGARSSPASGYSSERAALVGAMEDLAARPHHGAWLRETGVEAPTGMRRTCCATSYLVIPGRARRCRWPHEKLRTRSVSAMARCHRCGGAPLGTLKEVLFTAANEVYVIAARRARS